MSSEIEDSDSEAHSNGFQEIVKRKKLNWLKIRYSRAFLLTIAKLDICKRPPPGGISPSVLLEVVDDTPRDFHESWGRVGDLSADSKIENCSSQAFKRGSVLGQPYLVKPQWLNGNGESNSHKSRNSDAPQYRDGISDQCDKEAPKIGPYQLRRSANPYRPPHCHQVGNAKFEEESLRKKHNSFQEIHLTIQKETCPRASNVSRDKDQEINLPSESVTEPSSNLSTNLPNAAKVESDMGCSPNLHVCATETLGSSLKSSREKESAILETRDDDKPISDIQFNHLCRFAALHSGKKGAAESTKSIDDSKPYEFSFFDAFDFLTPNADEGTITFEDVWSEVSAILRFEREMDLTSEAEYGETAEYEILASLLDEGSDISISCPPSCEPSKGYNCGYCAAADAYAETCLPADDNCDDNANSDADICLPDEHNSDDNANSDVNICWPDENSLFSIDDMIALDSWRSEDTNTQTKSDTLTSDPTDRFAKGSVAVDTSPHKKRSALQHSAVSPFRGTKAPLLHQKSPVQQAYQSHWTTSAVIRPLHYQQTEIALQMPLVAPVALIPSGVNWYSCANMHNQPSTEECKVVHQYSLWQQPSAFLIAYQC
ncbi:OLC1v1027496C1 [Oldenlandia corymbosa var. corymbosa]|uniref:OLC1v1027496C1 n=1 Tax=Oldenlandia corymbosa var. corymbosa TaxID=529605 RepID=A0AAV1CCU6_OLDCO|nr:OLC1v1027496C1 [Oldenlandia corymbosa var. corymbosa]